MNEIKRALWKCDDFLQNKQKNIEEQTVFQEELVHIKARRNGEYLSDGDAKISEDTSPQQNLVGLAFSGGGIRSATFGLGVLEALKNQNLLKKIDYLSTVSGGGYIGAWLSANCKRATDCDIRVCLTNNEIKKNEIINQFKTEFSSKKNAYALLVIGIESESQQEWTVAGFNDDNQFKTVHIDENHKLAKELKNRPVLNNANDKILNSLKKVLPKNIDKITSIDLNADDINKYKIIELASSSINKTAPSHWLTKQADWKKSIHHLRRNSNYLSPKVGFFSADMWTMATIWLRNTLLVQLLLILAVACLLILPRPLFILYQQFLNTNLHWGAILAWHWVTIILYILVVISIASNILRINKPKSKYLMIYNWKIKFLIAIFCLFFAYIIANDNGYSFTVLNSTVSLSIYTKLTIAISFVLAGFLLLPTLVKIKNLIWSDDKDLIKQINYTQKDVQSYVILPLLVVSLLFSAILQQFVLNHESLSSMTFGEVFIYSLDKWPISILITFASLWLLSICSIREPDSTRRDDKIRHLKKSLFVSLLLAPLVAAITLQALLSAILLFLTLKCEFCPYEQWMFFIWTAPLLLFTLTLVIVILIGMIGRESSDAVREWWGRYSAWLAIYGFCWMVLVAIGIYGPWLSALLLDNNDMWGNGVSLAWIMTTLAGFFASKSSSTNESSTQNSTTKLKEIIAKIAPFIFIIGLLIIISTALHLIFVSNTAIEETEFSANYLRHTHWYVLSELKIEVISLVFVMCLISVLLLGYRVDINEFSLNAFYRSRLIRCYLGATRFRKNQRQPQYFTGFDKQDDLTMAELIDSNKKQLPTV